MEVAHLVCNAKQLGRDIRLSLAMARISSSGMAAIGVGSCPPTPKTCVGTESEIHSLRSANLLLAVVTDRIFAKHAEPLLPVLPIAALLHKIA